MRAAVALVVTSLVGGCGTTSSTTNDAGIADVAIDVAIDAPRALCVDGKSVDGEYPRADYQIAMGSVPPDLTFPGTEADGAPRSFSFHEYFDPCAARPRLLVVRVMASWCGTCRWNGKRTKELLTAAVSDRIHLLDLLVANEDNVPATIDDIAAYRSLLDAQPRVGIDPQFRLAPARLGRGPLPSYALIDTRTMKLLVVMDDPDHEEVLDRVRLELARIDGVKAAPGKFSPRVDGLTAKQWDLLRDITLPGAPPADPTNAKADDPAAAALGKALFSDASLSPSGSVSCATCHDAVKSFADGRARSSGVASGDRNSPSVLFASHARWQFWDGRADTLWAQAAGPFENPTEFGSNRLFVAHAIFDRYRAAYEAVFGPLPPLGDLVRFPANGKPGDVAWSSMTAADQTGATRVFVNVAKAIAAFERTLRAKPNALDRFIGGESFALTPEQKTGLDTFFSAGCIQCHYGPRLTDDAFHNVRFPTGRADGTPDQGRALGLAALLASEFRSDGPFSDAPGAARSFATLTSGKWAVGAFKTPPLRGTTSTGPWGHGGSLATMDDVIKVYSTAGLKAGDPRAVGESEPWVTMFLDAHGAEVAAFMKVLAAEPSP